MEDRKITDLTTDELVKDLVFCNKMKKFYYARYDEVMKELERRSEGGK